MKETMRVWHLKNDVDYELRYKLMSDNYIVDPIESDIYFDAVADVEAEADTPEALLEVAFRLTNHIDSDWTENPGVTKLAKGGVRSTSVGDLVELNGRMWKVAGVGFKLQ